MKKSKKHDERIWIDKDKNICDDCFIQRFPDFSYKGSTALSIWRMAWNYPGKLKKTKNL